MKFKIQTIATCILLWIASSVDAQTSSIGLRGGYQMTSLGDHAWDEYKNGYDLGIQYIFSQKEKYGFGVDLNYANTGGGYYSERFRNENYYLSRVHLNSVQLQPMAFYFFGDVEDRLRPKLAIGPSLSYIFNASNVSTSADRSDDFMDFSLELVGSVGFNYQLRESLWLTVDLQYQQGLTELNEIPTINPNTMRNHAAGVKVGIASGLPFQ